MELLVVITIIGILIALLLPAVQAAREAARQVQCKNNLKELALACLNHENATSRFPTGGWGCAWTGDADRGTDWRQPGGWIFNVLPYMEQRPLYDLGTGLGAWNSTAKKDAHLQRMSIPLGVLYCPTRRRAIAYPWVQSGTGAGSGGIGVVNAGMPSMVGRTDYALNAGDYFNHLGATWIQIYWQSASSNTSTGPRNVNEVENPLGQMTANARNTFAGIAAVATGVVYAGSMVKLADVRDGTSNTYLAGEKYLMSDNYNTGVDGGDNEEAVMGDNADLSRWTALSGMDESGVYTNPLPPWPDTPGFGGSGSWILFGSAHVNGLHMAFCDGAVQMISYSIDPQVHGKLGNRDDGRAIDANAF